MPQHVAYVTAVPVHSGRVEEKYLPAADRLLGDIAAISGVEAAATAHAGPVRRRTTARRRRRRRRRSDLQEATMTLDAGREIDASLQPSNAFGVSADYFKVHGHSA